MGKILHFDGHPNTITVPDDSDILIGSSVEVFSADEAAGTKLIIAPGVGVTLQGFLNSDQSYIKMQLIKTGATTWQVLGGTS
jgi:hypothetical protein